MSEVSSRSKLKQIGVAVIRDRQGKVLIDRRRTESAMGGFWEFPGGKIEPNETVVECIRREIREELAIEVEVKERLMVVNYSYPDFQVALFVHNCQYQDGTPQPLACEEIRWVEVDEIHKYQFPPANQAIVATLQQNAN